MDTQAANRPANNLVLANAITNRPDKAAAPIASHRIPTVDVPGACPFAMPRHERRRSGVICRTCQNVADAAPVRAPNYNRTFALLASLSRYNTRLRSGFVSWLGS